MLRTFFFLPQKEVYKHDFSRLAAVSFAVVKNLGDLSETVTVGDLRETVTCPPPAPLINSGKKSLGRALTAP